MTTPTDQTHLDASERRSPAPPTPAYVSGHLNDVRMGPEIVAYLEAIDDTLEPFQGKFLIHGGSPETLEGTWQGDLIVIAFPDLDHARAWYRSDAYQQIVPLRAENSTGDIIVIDGVPTDHHATDILQPKPEQDT